MSLTGFYLFAVFAGLFLMGVVLLVNKK